MNKTTVLQRVQQMTQQALEREAEKILNIEAIKAQISASAAEGYYFSTINTERSIDISKTKSAIYVTKLLKSEGFVTEWDLRQHSSGYFSSSLKISWYPNTAT